MSPSPRPLPKPGHGPAPEGVAESATGHVSGSASASAAGPASGAGSGSGASYSMAASLAVHGLALATLVMAVRLPWTGASDKPERIVTCTIEPARAPASARDDREPPLEIEAHGWESEPPMTDDFELPEEPALEPLSGAADDVPIYRPPARDINPFAEPTLEPTLHLAPKARPKLVRPRSLPSDAAPGSLPLPGLDLPSSTAPLKAPVPNASPEPLEGACPRPIFPKIAQLRGWSGTVYLWIDVSASGTVTDVRIETSSGHAILDEAAIKAVKGWRFTPAVNRGVPAAVTVRKPIEFSLGGA